MNYIRMAMHAGAPEQQPSAGVRADPVYVLKAQFFRVLGHPVRIRILELLVEGERTVGDLQAELRLDSSGTSHHLSALRQLGVLENRRAGTNVYYRIRDPLVVELLAVARRIITSALTVSSEVLDTIAHETPARTPPPS